MNMSNLLGITGRINNSIREDKVDDNNDQRLPTDRRALKSGFTSQNLGLELQ